MHPIIPAVLLAFLLTAHARAEGISVDPIVPIEADRVTHQTLPDIVYRESDIHRRLPSDRRLALVKMLTDIEQDIQFGGISAAVLIPGEGVWQWSSGIADHRSGEALETGHLMHLGSIGKIATAGLIWQLIEQQRLQLDQSIAPFFPDWPDVSDVTIAQLLNHTSGIYSFNWSPLVRASTVHWQAHELLTIARDQPLLFEPGTQWSYSNTNYLMLGLIAEQLHQSDFRRLLDQQLLQPLRLANSVVLEAESAADIVLPSYLDGELQPGHYALPHGAGTLAMTPHDLVNWFYQLLSGQWLQRASVQSMLEQLLPMSHQDGLYYGLGLMRLDTPVGPWIMHSGGIAGYRSMVAYSPAYNCFVAVISNHGEDAAPLSLKLMETMAAVERQRQTTAVETNARHHHQ
ncbi:MAG: serine hydrolase domain-containing protein [Wenzhouxiangellaceae bacterium]